MSEFDTLKFVTNQLKDVDMDAKRDSLIAASKEKLLTLRTQRAEAMQREAVLEQEKEANKDTWAGRLGADLNSTPGIIIDTAAKLASGASRIVGNTVGGLISLDAGANVAEVNEDDITAFNRFKVGQATPEDLVRLNEKKYQMNINNNIQPGQGANQAAAPIAASAMEMLERNLKSREIARGVNEFFDISSIASKSAQNKMIEEAKPEFKAGWDKLTKALADPSESKYMFIPGAPKLVSVGNTPIEGMEFQPGDWDSVPTKDGVALIKKGTQKQFEKDGKHFGVFADDEGAIGYLQQLNKLASESKTQKAIGPKAPEGTSTADRGVEAVSALADLILTSGKTIINNPRAISGFVAENAPQLAVGAVGTLGRMTMGASNIGYAANEYEKGIAEYMKSSGGRLPPEKERREMALYAASLALAEQLGDTAALAAGKASKLFGQSAKVADGAKTGVVQSAKNIAGATATGFGSEAATEGYQTWAEGEINRPANNKGADPFDIFMGATIGGATGGTLTGGLRTGAELVSATPEKQEAQTRLKADRELFNESAKNNDTSAYDDAAKPTYDPTKAMGVLLSHAQMDDTAPEVKEANLAKASELLANLEAEHAKAEESAQARSPEGIQAAEAKIQQINDLIAETDPADTARLDQLTEIASVLQEDLADLQDSKKATVANTKYSRLTRQLETSRELFNGLSTAAVPAATQDEVNTAIAEVSTPSAVDRVINLSMRKPESLTSEAALKLADDTSNALTSEQREYMRAFSDARIKENMLSTMSKVSQEVLVGSNKNVGISQYKSRIAAALAANNQTVASRQLELLTKFSEDHANKYATARKTIAKHGMGAQIMRRKDGWVGYPAGTYTAREVQTNGGLTLNSGRLVDDINKESQALKAATAEMKLATDLKFRVQSVSSAKQTQPVNNINSPQDEEETARPEETSEPTGRIPSPKVVLKGEETQKRVDAAARGERTKPVKSNLTESQQKRLDNEAKIKELGRQAEASSATKKRIDALRKEIASIEENNKAGTVPSWFTVDEDNIEDAVLIAVDPSGDYFEVEDVQTQINKVKTHPDGIRAGMWELVRSGQLNNRKNLLADLIKGKIPDTNQTDREFKGIEQSEAAEQPAVVSEANPAPVVDAATTEAVVENKKGVLSLFNKATAKGVEVAYNARNLIADFFVQDKANDATARPLASIADFVSAAKADPTILSNYLADAMTPAQEKLVSAFLASATAWDSKIASSLIRKNPAYSYQDLAQFFLLDDKLDMDQNVKTAISYAAFQAMIDLYGNGRYNDDKAINGILGKDADALVDPAAREMLGEAGTLEKTLKNSWGQSVVSALGLKPTADAPINLLPALEANMGAHVHKLLMELGVIERTSIARSDLNEFSSFAKRGEVTTKDDFTEVQFARLIRDADGAVKPLVQKIVDTNKGTQSVLSKLFGAEAFFIEPTTKPVKFSQKKAGDGRMDIPNELRSIIDRSNKAEYKLNNDLFNYVLGQVSPEIALEMAGEEAVTENMHKSRRVGAQAKNDGLRREYDRLMDFVKGTLNDDLDTPIYFQHDVWVQQRVGILTNMVNPQTSKLQRHMLYQPSWETKVGMGDLDNFLLRVGEGLGVKTDKQSREKSLEDVHAKLQTKEIKAAINVLNKARNMTGLTENEQAVLAAGVKAGGENFHSLSVLMAMADYVQAKKAGQAEFTTRLMAEVDGVTNGPMFSHLLMGAGTSAGNLFKMLNKGGFYQNGSTQGQYNVWRSVAGHMDLYETTTRNVLNSTKQLLADNEIVKADLDAVLFFTGKLENADNSITKAGRNIIKTPLTAMVFGSSVVSAVDSMADTFVDDIYAGIEDLAKDPSKKDAFITNLNKLGVQWKASMSVQDMLDTNFNKREITALKSALKDTLGKAVAATMKQDFERFLSQRTKFNQTAQLTFEIYNAAYTAEREKLIKELMEAGTIAVNPTTGKPLHDLTQAQEKEVRARIKALEPVIHSAMSKDSKQLDAGLYMENYDRSFSDDPTYRNEVHFGTEVRGTGKKSSNVAGYKSAATNPGVKMAPLSIHSFDSMVSHYAAKLGNVLNIHDAHGTGLGQIQQAARNLNQAVWNAAVNYSPAQEMSDALMRTIKGVASTYKDGVPEAVLKTLAESMKVLAEKLDVPPKAMLTLLATEAKVAAYTADSVKLEAMQEMAYIDQYAMEGGNYQVTAEDRSTAASLRSALVVGLSASDLEILNKIDDQLDKVMDGKAVDQSKVDKNEMDMLVAPQSSVAELGKAAVKSDPVLVKAFQQTPVMGIKQAVALLRGSVEGEFGQRLLSALERSTAADITIHYVTPQTLPGELLELGGEKSRGWYVSKEGKHAIYVLSPEFKHSGLTAEVLMHELTHAALARTIEEAQATGTGPAFELVAELEQLLTKAISFANANKLMAEFAPALENVHELVSWGMNNARFQSEILMKVELNSQTTGNKLLNGLQSFIATLTKLMFGSANVNLNNGMSVLIQNVSGLMKQAAQSKNDVKSVSVVLNQINNNQNVRDLTTMDIYAALEQNNNGKVVSAEFSSKLQGLLEDLVNRLHGPAGSFKEAIMQQTATAPEAVFAQAMVDGVAPLAFDALAAGFPFTQQEAFVAEQVHATMLEAMTNATGLTSVAYRELAKLYTEVRSKLKPSDFATGMTPAEKAQGQALYDFIFNVQQGADGRSDYLARFAAMGMAHEGFSKLLQMATDRASSNTANLSFNERLNRIFETVMNWFTGKMTNTIEGQPADAKLTSLVTQLVKIEERKRAVMKIKADTLSPVETVINDLGEAGKRKLEAFGKLPFFQNSRNGIVRLAGSLTSAYAGDRVDAIMEGFNRMRDQHFRGQQGVVASLVNEFRGANEGNMVFHFLLRASKFIEGQRKDIITYTGKMVLGSFANDGMDLTADQKDGITAVFLRTDMSSLLGQYNMAQLNEMINDKARLQREIDAVEAKLNGKFKTFYSNSAKALAYYKATGRVTNAHLLMNAQNIAKMYGTSQQNNVTVAQAEAAAPIIDSLVSLYAVLYSPDKHINAAREVLKVEMKRTDGGNGVEAVLLTHAKMQAESKTKLFSGAEALQMKGYTPEIYDPYMAVVVADEVEGKTLELQGYTKGALVQNDSADPSNVKRHIYHLRDGGLKQQLTGVFSYTGMRARGRTQHNGNLSPLSLTGQINIAEMKTIATRKAKSINNLFLDKSFDPQQVTDNHLAPVLNADGNVANYRYLMNENTKDTLLDRDNRPEKVLGMLAGQTFDKVASVDQNRRGVAALFEQYKQEFAERPESYVTVGPRSTDPQLREIWAMLPETTKSAVREIWGTEQMKVRVDLLDINFGYRKLSIADAFDKVEAERNFVEKMFVQVMTNAFDEKAGLRVRQAEDIWQAVVKATKANLVVKSISTFTGNMRSNWSQLLLMGVSPAKILEHHRVAFKGAWAYKKDSEELFNLQHQISTGYIQPGETIADIKNKIVRLQDALARNPVKPLIDAGLMPTIVEDVVADDDIYSYKSRFVKATESFTSKINPHVLGVGREVLMLEGSRAFRTMSYATQISDFLARYTLYQVKVSQGMSDAEAVQLASDAFINYDVPTHRLVQYANDSGLVMFTKYYMRIQKMLLKIYKDSPGRVLALIAAESMIGAQPTVLDSSMITRWGNPLNLGALDYPGSLSSLATVRVITSPFSGGGNPAE